MVSLSPGVPLLDGLEGAVLGADVLNRAAVSHLRREGHRLDELGHDAVTAAVLDGDDPRRRILDWEKLDKGLCCGLSIYSQFSVHR